MTRTFDFVLKNYIKSVILFFSPNWSRTAQMNRRGRGNWRFRRPGLSVPFRSSMANRPGRIRRFYFKRFKDHIGYSGRGYGHRGARATTDDEECNCCAVLLEGNRLITAFPMLTLDAERHGTGAKDVVGEVIDPSTFDSTSTISSSESIELEDGSGKSLDASLKTALSPDTSTKEMEKEQMPAANAEGRKEVDEKEKDGSDPKSEEENSDDAA